MKESIGDASKLKVSLTSKTDVIKKLTNLSDEVNQGVIECVVYGKMGYMNLSKWVNNLADWICKANRMSCGAKLTKKNYLDSLFKDCKRNLIDAGVALDNYLKSKKPEYPDFEIDDSNVRRLITAYDKVTSTSIPVLMSAKIVIERKWVELLTPIFQ